MIFKKILLIILPLTVLCACNPNANTISSNTQNEQENTDIDEEDTGGTQQEDEDEEGDEEEEETSQFVRQQLECGYKQTYLPKNSNNPTVLKTTLTEDSSSWSNNQMIDSMPINYRYIYRNACDDGPTGEKASASFYSYNPSKPKDYPGGLKMTRTGEGFETNMFTHTGAKLEIRLGISQVNNNSKQPEKDKDPIHVYFFNKYGTKIGLKTFGVGSITANTTELKMYYTESNTKDVAYIEVRLNALPYKSSQSYNIGISYFNIKSWESI